MKKYILIGTMAAMLSGLSAFGQGQFFFQGSARNVWDDWSTAAFKADQSNNVAFLFYNGVGSTTPLVDQFGAQVVTNATTLPGGATATTAWNAILTDPNFRLATNTVGGTLVQAQTTLVGGWSAGTIVATNSPGSGTITAFVIGWSYLYADPLAAQAAGSPLGWSAPFTYTIGSPGGAVAQPFTTSPNVFIPFGVAPVPEPTTFALAGLGAATLLIFRRRKQ